MPVVRQRLTEKGIKYIEAHVEESGMLVTQVVPLLCPQTRMFLECQRANCLHLGSCT